MITHKIKTTSGLIPITIPGNIDELTMGMLIKLTPEPGDTLMSLQQLSVLSGIPLETDGPDDICLYDVCDMESLDIFSDTLKVLEYQLLSLKDERSIPESVTLPVTAKHSKKWFNIRGISNIKKVKVLDNLTIQPAGAYMEAKQAIAGDFKEWQEHNPDDKDLTLYAPKISTMIRVLSLYLYCQATGEKFNRKRAAEFDSVVEQMPVSVALPIATYFFLRYLNLLKSNQTY